MPTVGLQGQKSPPHSPSQRYCPVKVVPHFNFILVNLSGLECKLCCNSPYIKENRPKHSNQVLSTPGNY